MKRCVRHNFTRLAPDCDGHPNPLFIDKDMWFWCIRCGTLKLNNELFRPGKHQKKVIVPDIPPFLKVKP